MHPLAHSDGRPTIIITQTAHSSPTRRRALRTEICKIHKTNLVYLAEPVPSSTAIWRGDTTMAIERRLGTAAVMVMAAATIAGCSTTTASERVPPVAEDRQVKAAPSASDGSEGQRVFRFDTFGDEVVWTDKLRLHEVIEKSVDPTTALKVGLKVDSEVLPPGLLKKVDLNSPATTVALLKMNAVVGLQGTVDANNHLTRVGVTCALCHSTVDNFVMPGIGRRKDGWPNRDLNVGAIIALSPAATAAQKTVYTSWGPGKYDPRYNQDGKNTPLVLPPA